VAVAILALLPVVAYAFAPHTPGALKVAPGQAQPVIARLTWNASADAVSYSVSAATSAGGPFRIVGSTETTGYDFKDGLGGVGYYFAVEAVSKDGELSAPAESPAPITAAWTSDPHAPATRVTNKCSSCHTPHAALASPLLRTEVTTDSPGQEATCLTCHDGKISSAGNVAAGPKDSFSLASGHALDTSSAVGGLTTDCSSCHNPHGSAATSPMIPADNISGGVVASTSSGWCLACHDDKNTWFTSPSTYPTASVPQRDVAGYPVSGTWLGAGVYTGASNAHRLIPETTQTAASGQVVRRDAGACLYCHAAHRGPNAYDGLLATYRPTTSATLAADKASGDYAALCFTCHGGTKPGGFAETPVDIRSIVTSTAPNAGHRVVTPGGLLPVGSPLPCYECHNPHGSTRGNDSMISDVLGASLSTTGSPEAVRRFCFTCHTTPDTTSGNAKGWDSASATYTVVAGDEKVVGLSRTSGALALRNISGHQQGDTGSCYICHGNDYADGGNNVHSPGAGTMPSHRSESSECMGSGCHGSSPELTDVHAGFVGSASAKYPQYATACDLCHANEAPDRIDWTSASTTCVSCHPAYHGVSHTSTTNTTCFGLGCHDASRNLPTVHAAYAGLGSENPQYANACALCHANPAVDTATSGTACTGTCHSGTTHSQMNTKHTVTSASSACTGCHASDINTVHGTYADLTKCATCHSQPDNWAKTGDCAWCHSATTPHPDQAGIHDATGIGSGDIVMGLDDGDHNGLVINESCGRCHYADLVVQHASQCQYCHTGAGTPTAPGGTWDKSCQQGSCHPTIHAATLTTDDHFGAYWNSSSSCDVCHDDGSPWPGSGDNCDVCHSPVQTIPDSQPPVTSSDAVGSYSGAANITLSAVDLGGSGVAGTYYKLDLGAWQQGTLVAVAPPSSGTATHELQYYSADIVGNAEASKSAIFTVAGPGPADTTAPAGTMTVSNDAAYVNNSTSYLTASISDAGTGLYGQSVDPGTGTFGAWSAYNPNQLTPLTAPDGLKTVRVQYKDYAGNIAIKTDTVTRDTLGPVSTTGATNGVSYNGDQSFMPDAADALSGVNRKYVQVDGGSYTLWPTGTPVVITAPASGAVGHTVRCYAVDNAGNTGSANVTSFVVYANTDVTPPSGAMSINSGSVATSLTAATIDSAVTDSGSGMSQMRVDQSGTGVYGAWGAYSASYSVVLPTGSGTKTVNVQYRDVSGNVLTLSDTIILDTTAPAGTMSVNGGAAETDNVAVTVNSAVTDSPSGMYQMRIDPGSGAYGGWIAYGTSSPINLSSGSGTKTVRVQYMDNAGNTITLSDTIVLNVPVLDTTPPTTTSSVVSGQTYVGDQTFTFTGTDSGSGVASTWYKLDTGPWTQGNSVFVVASFGSVSHVLSWYSIDFTNNQEVDRSASFTIQPSSGGLANFSFTGADQTFTVPSGVTAVTVDLYGGEGGEYDTWAGGLGGGVHAVVPVTPGQILTVRVGGCPGADNPTGAWPNGGSGAHGGSGGGSSALLSGSAIWLEAGGGGGGDHNGYDGGPGGAPGWLPGGGQVGGDSNGAAGGGGWNGGAGYPRHTGGGDGGTSYIALGTGLLSEGVNIGDGSASVSW
jgi:hypothetical protein